MIGWRWPLILAALASGVVGWAVTRLPHSLEWAELAFGVPLILGDSNPATAIVDPVVGQALTVNTADLFDGDGIVGPFTYQWQTQDAARLRWVPITGATRAT